MKPLFVFFLLTFSLSACFGSCDKSGLFVSNIITQNNDTTIMGAKINIKIGSSTFTAILFENATANAFKAMLPIAVNMTELNGNEKYFDFSSSLPTIASKPATIHTGDLMIWGSNTLVLFYKDFSTSYSYTKLGKINDISGLAAAVGSGDVKVSFELQ